MPGLLNGDYRQPTWDKPYRGLVDSSGNPLRPEGRTATERFANGIGVQRGPESGFALPQVLTFSSILGSAFRNYYHGQYDEAMRFSREDALAMRNDAYVMSLLNERKNAVATLKYHLEVPNPKDQWQIAVRDGLTQLLRMIPKWTNLTLSGLEAIWFGRAGDQIEPKFKSVKLPALPSTASGGGLPTVSVAPSAGQLEERQALCIVRHAPIEGDKIDYDYDGNPYILVTPMAAIKLLEAGGDVRRWDGKEWQPDDGSSSYPQIRAAHAEFGYTTIGGRALYLKGTWRDRFRIHTHEALDASFFQPWKASAMHGVGIRSVIFWYWWLRQEFLANVTDWCARTGLGIRIWYYESGNNASEQAVDQAARDQTDRVNIKVPYNPGDPHRPALEFQETSGTGADLLLRIVKHVEDYIERFIVGQSMSAGGDDFASSLGDQGRKSMASNTQYQITKLDAARFADTNTTDLIDLIKRWTYPEFEDLPFKMVYDVDDPEVEKWVKGAKDFVDMGGKIVADEARSRLGLSSPKPDDETVGGMEQLQAQQATSGHIKPPEGLSPGGTGPAQADGSDAQPQQSQEQPEPSRYAAVLPTSHGHIIEPKSGEKATGFVTVGEGGGGHAPAHAPAHSPAPSLPHPDELAKSLAPTPSQAPSAPVGTPVPTGDAQAPAPVAPAALPSPDLMAKALGVYPKIEHIARKYATGSRESGKMFEEGDLAQEGYLAVVNALPNYDPARGDFDSWAKNVAANRIKDILKSPRGKLKGFGTDFDPGNIAERPQEPQGPTEADLRAIIGKLSGIRRRVMEGAMDRKTDDQIAQEEGVSRSTITRTRQQTTADLREQMQPSEQYALALQNLRYICPDVPERSGGDQSPPEQYADGRSGDYRVHKGRSIEHAVERLRSLDFDDLNDMGDVERVVAAIAKQFTATELREVCEQFGIGGLRLKGKMIEAIIKRIIETVQEEEKKSAEAAKEAAKVQDEKDAQERSEREAREAREKAEKKDREEKEAKEAKEAMQQQDAAVRYAASLEKTLETLATTMNKKDETRVDRLEKAVEALVEVMIHQAKNPPAAPTITVNVPKQEPPVVNVMPDDRRIEVERDKSGKVIGAKKVKD